MRHAKSKLVLIGVLAAVALFAMAAVAHAAPLVPVGYGWVDGPHTSYPGYCLGCHTGFAYGNPPTIPAGSTPAHHDRGPTCTQCHTIASPPPPTGPAPHIAYLKWTNPIAYSIASKVMTRFYCSIDVTGAVAVMTVATASGTKTIYNGPVNVANKAVYFPAWTGKDTNGKTMPSSSYAYTLKVTTSGGTATATGKITVSKIWFTMAGTAATGASKVHQGYMLPGSANVYVGATTTMASDSLKMKLTGPGGLNLALPPFACGSAARMNLTSYVRPPAAIKAKGVQTFTLSATNVTYGITVIQ